MKTVFLTFCTILVAATGYAAQQPNLLIITVDDMSCDSVGVFGCKLPETTPAIDRLASQGMRFEFAHVQVGNCMPSRNVMYSGRYPHNNRVEGFYQVKDADYPVLADLAKQAGYFTAIEHKVSHSTPYSPYGWDLVLGTSPDGKLAHIKDAQTYGDATEQGIRAAVKADKPFCLVINVADPHKPFYAEGRGGETIPDPHVPTRVYSPDEVPVPGFLPDDPVVRKELSHYYSSVRRADDCVAAILAALEDSGQSKNTVVMFLSDHGMPLPFAKTQLYHHSTRTPWIVRWPGVVKVNSVDRQHMISAVDMLPTLLDIIQSDCPIGMDGRTFAPLLRGETQENRDLVIKEYNENAGGSRDPMRAVETKQYLYLFNAWSDGERIMKTATQGTPTYRRMKQLAETDSEVAARVELFDHRVLEELYDIREDPDCLNNLIESAEHQQPLNELRDAFETWMVDTGDHLLEVFQHRNDPAVRGAYMRRVTEESAARRARKPDSKPKRQRKLISWKLPPSATAGETVTIGVQYRLPKELGEQLIHVTLKGGQAAHRIERKVVTVAGEGKVDVTFELPEEVSGNVISFAAFVGADFQTSLQHIQSDEVPIAVDRRL